MFKKNSLMKIFEQEEKPKGSPEEDVFLKSDKLKARKSKHSVDDQIDALILRYEASSIREEEDVLMESLYRSSLRFLFEQEEEAAAEEGGEGGEEAAGDEEAASPTGSEAMTTKAPGEQEVPDLNIDAFASRTVRLINNPMNLLDIKTAILNRIKNFLDENYGDQFVNRYLEVLENEFGIETEEFDTQDMEQTSDDSFAVGANPAGAGMS
tara:strand:+ start:279 stop:908 length:630 start_codon:yes stop_codon:yes gene_type:complete